MKNTNTSILLVDDHAIVRCGIRSLIERNQGMTICGEADCLEEAYEKTEQLKPSVVLLDIKLPDGDGVVGCAKIKKISPATKVIILTAYTDDSLVLEAIRAGADGYLLKSVNSKAIISAIQGVLKGESVLDQSILSKVLGVIKGEANSVSIFSDQEKNILDLLSMGKTNKEISENLFIAEKTVRNYVSKIMKKINVNNRTEAAMYWSKQKSLK